MLMLKLSLCREKKDRPARSRLAALACVVAVAWVMCWLPAAAQAADGPLSGGANSFFHVIEVDDLEMDEAARRALNGWSPEAPWVHIEGEGQAYLGGLNRWVPQRPNDPAARIAIALPQRRDVEGVLILPSLKGGASRVPFSVSAEELEERAGEDFYETVADHYRELQSRNFAGRAWFRSQAHAAEQMLGEEARAATRRRFGGRADMFDMNDTFDIFSGTTAAGENLRLDDLLAPAQEQMIADVDLSEVRGITIDAIEWDDLIEDPDPATDAAAAYVPGDQLTIFFEDVQALATTLTEYEQQGTQLIQWSLQAEEADVQQRYERQLAVTVASLMDDAEQLGLGEVTLTAGDPYIMAGTDLAILMHSTNPEQLKQSLAARQQQAAEAAGVQVRSQQIGALEATVVRTEDRTISSYLALLDGGMVVLTNSPVQLERIAETAADERTSLADLDDYTYFRNRYRLDEPETLLLVISDDALRRWGSPQVRIAASRRARVMAAMLEARARHLEELLEDAVEPRALAMQVAVPGTGELRLTEEGRVVSEVYGRPGFLTPINELAITHASETEAEAYRNWRARYEGQWRAVFDPIAVRLTVEPTQLSGDLTVLPLSVGSQYRDWVEIVGGARITAEGPIYDQALAHFAMAVDVESEPLQDMQNFARQGLAGIDNPFGWLGEVVGVYIDESEFWGEMAEADDIEQFVEAQNYSFPIAAYAEVKGRVQLATFLTGLRTMVQSTAPGLVQWVNRRHNEREYVAVVAEGDEFIPGMAIYYAIHRNMLLLTLNEQTMQRFLETTDEAAPGDEAAPPWLAEHVNFQITGTAVRFVQQMSLNPEFGGMGGEASWRYLPVLNDFRQHFPDHDPVAVYEELYGARPVDVYGGDFEWSQEHLTMISTAVGHPLSPRVPETMPPPFDRLDYANFGLDFDDTHDALRARMLLNRQAE
ncbi:MAG: hypothetical protein WD294_06540 [Phycisphaeraceae bacterium]